MSSLTAPTPATLAHERQPLLARSESASTRHNKELGSQLLTFGAFACLGGYVLENYLLNKHTKFETRLDFGGVLSFALFINIYASAVFALNNVAARALNQSMERACFDERSGLISILCSFMFGTTASWLQVKSTQMNEADAERFSYPAALIYSGLICTTSSVITCFCAFLYRVDAREEVQAASIQPDERV